MTIALGLLSLDSIVIAADSNVVLTDGARTQALKVADIETGTGAYAIANAAEDGNAAKTLVGHLTTDLKRKEPQTLEEVEEAVAERMTVWASAFAKIPNVQLVMGAYLYSETQFPNNFGLYFCEPPNTVVRSVLNDDSKGAVFIGSGASIAEPLYRTLFFGSGSARLRLLQISYLMHKAKSGNALCGGHTNAVVLKHGRREPLWISPIQMAAAENLGHTFDFILNGTAAATILQADDASAKRMAEQLEEIIVTQGKRFRGLRITALSGEEI
jgi:hypothetical protein